jgi:hypothetical protein
MYFGRLRHPQELRGTDLKFVTDKYIEVEGGEKELGLKNTLVSNMILRKIILHYCHGLKTTNTL